VSRGKELRLLRETAERCYRLSRATNDSGAKANLIELGREMDQEIAKLEAQQTSTG
jgi:hypothetical protein